MRSPITEKQLQENLLLHLAITELGSKPNNRTHVPTHHRFQEFQKSSTFKGLRIPAPLNHATVSGKVWNATRSKTILNPIATFCQNPIAKHHRQILDPLRSTRTQGKNNQTTK